MPKFRDAALLAFPAVVLAMPVFADSLGMDTVGLPANIDPGSIGMLMCVYVLREAYMRQSRLLESLITQQREQKSEG